MTSSSTATLSDADYQVVETVLRSSERGRQFLRVYLERNRSVETIRLLRSMSRLHRAVIGTPGVRAEISRDLAGLLRTVSMIRERAATGDDREDRARDMLTGLETVEASLLVLLESLEDAFEAQTISTRQPPEVAEDHAGTRKLYGELSTIFLSDRR